MLNMQGRLMISKQQRQLGRSCAIELLKNYCYTKLDT